MICQAHGCGLGCSTAFRCVLLFILAFCVLVSLLPPVHAALFAQPEALPATKSYDYIVVGAGPGGCVLARRLTEDPHTTVLLIEAGPSDTGVLPIEVPLLARQLQPNTAYDWNYTTVPQSGLNGRTVPYARGRVLGGSTSINFMVYSRGSKDDFNKYAELSEDSGWSWAAIEPYFRKLERLVPPADGHNTAGEIMSSIHGTAGPLNISLPGTLLPSDSHIQQTTREMSHEFPFNEDMNSGNPVGIGWLQGTYGGGIRQSASRAYLEPVLGRANLDVLVNTTVTEIIQTSIERGKHAFRGVQIAQSNSSAPRYNLNATKEVILATGALNTPQLLLLSGIGPFDTLRRLGITPIVDLPDVGQHLVDHPQLTNQYGVVHPSDDVTDPLARNTTLRDALIAEWEAGRSGVMASTAQNHIGWLRFSESDDVFGEEGDPSAGPLSPHYELLFAPGFISSSGAPVPSTGSFMSFYTIIVTPTSRGTVTLNSTDPFDPPVINPNFLSTPFDIAAMRRAIRSVQRFASAPAWRGFLTGPAADFANVNISDDAQVDAWARAHTSTIWHPVGTARMGPYGEMGSVVNPDLTVKGTRGLRIVDASVLPLIPAAHPQAALYAFAERMADLIKSGESGC
ncbi:aryl-alcohol-oxidase from pleurotus Eryingii [Trametes meyenii]|nr:aryl-alcohol-oxidase from pleurotus Eryingii [Trametes meyenii]